MADGGGGPFARDVGFSILVSKLDFARLESDIVVIVNMKFMAPPYL